MEVWNTRSDRVPGAAIGPGSGHPAGDATRVQAAQSISRRTDSAMSCITWRFPDDPACRRSWRGPSAPARSGDRPERCRRLSGAVRPGLQAGAQARRPQSRPRARPADDRRQGAGPADASFRAGPYAVWPIDADGGGLARFMKIGIEPPFPACSCRWMETAYRLNSGWRRAARLASAVCGDSSGPWGGGALADRQARMGLPRRARKRNQAEGMRGTVKTMPLTGSQVLKLWELSCTRG